MKSRTCCKISNLASYLTRLGENVGGLGRADVPGELRAWSGNIALVIMSTLGYLRQDSELVNNYTR
jgi:hypothetical protein